MKNLKKILSILIVVMYFVPNAYCSNENKTACGFVRVTTNMFGYNFLAKKIAQAVLRKSLNDAAKGDYKVKFDSFSGVDLKKGKFKGLTIDGKNLLVDKKLSVSNLSLKTTSDFNYVDYRKNPIEFKTDLPMDFNIILTESDLNHNFNELYGINVLCSMIPLIKVEKPVIKIVDEKIKLSSSLKMPLAKKIKFSLSTGLKVDNGKIALSNVETSGSKDFAENLIALINEQSLLDDINLPIFDNTDTKVSIKTVAIKDNMINISGKLLIKKSN